jgi:hypothetical protein
MISIIAVFTQKFPRPAQKIIVQHSSMYGNLWDEVPRRFHSIFRDNLIAIKVVVTQFFRPYPSFFHRGKQSYTAENRAAEGCKFTPDPTALDFSRRLLNRVILEAVRFELQGEHQSTDTASYNGNR